MIKMEKTTLETISYSSYQGTIVLSKGIDVAVEVDDSLTPSPKEHTAVVFMSLFSTNIKTMLLSRKSLFAVVALFLLMAAIDIATKTTYSTKISSSFNYLTGTDKWGVRDALAPGSCEVDGCGKADFLPTEDCQWGDATYSKDKGDQQGQKPGCTFCYSSERDSEDLFRAYHTFRYRFGAISSGVCKFKLPIGAECTTWRMNTPGYIGNIGSDEYCMTNNCVSDDPEAPTSRYSKWHCKA